LVQQLGPNSDKYRHAISLRRGSQLQRRFIHPSGSQIQPLPQPNTLLAKLRFRADGEPRSILRGLGYLNLVCILSYWSYELVSKTSDEIHEKSILEVEKKFEILIARLMAKLIYILKTDATYDSVNFDDPISTRSYFVKFCLDVTHTVSEEEELNQTFKNLMSRIIMKTKDGSKQSAEGPIHLIMRSSSEKIHDIIREFNSRCQDSKSDCHGWGEVLIAVGHANLEALHSISDLMHDFGYSSAAKWTILSG